MIRCLQIKEKGWRFTIKKDTETSFYVSIPDCGGMADMVPKDIKQKEWCQKEFKRFPFIKQVWTTVWEVSDQDKIKNIEDFLISQGAEILY